VTINNLLPERFDTDLQHQMAKAAMARENISHEEARAPDRVDRRKKARRG
jgi:3-oxoacyl-[acyl-carrier protein] reductase